MKPFKKVEIIIETIQQPRVTKLLNSLNIPYSVINEVAGKGRGATHDAKELTDVLSNCYIMSLCSEQEAQLVVQHIKPIISTYGGICCVSDVAKAITA